MDQKKTAGVLGRMFTDPVTAVPLISMLAAPLVGAGVNAGLDYKKRLDAAKEKTIAYREMLDLHPHLKTRDPATVSRIYNSLHNVNPVLSRDPLVAGAWVDNIMESKTMMHGGSHQMVLNAVKDLAGIRSQMSAAVKNEQGNMSAGARAESMLKDLGGNLGKAYQHADAQALEGGAKMLQTEARILDHRARMLDRREKGLQHYAEERMGESHGLSNADLADMLRGTTGPEKKASDQELEQLYTRLGV